MSVHVRGNDVGQPRLRSGLFSSDNTQKQVNATMGMSRVLIHINSTSVSVLKMSSKETNEWN